jgi:hypothetical protein
MARCLITHRDHFTLAAHPSWTGMNISMWAPREVGPIRTKIHPTTFGLSPQHQFHPNLGVKRAEGCGRRRFWWTALVDGTNQLGQRQASNKGLMCLLKGVPASDSPAAHRTCSHDTHAKIINALSVCSESEWKAAQVERVWERPAEELLKFTALPPTLLSLSLSLSLPVHYGSGLLPCLCVMHFHSDHDVRWPRALHTVGLFLRLAVGK